MPKNWIKGAIKKPGALTRMAKAKGLTVAQYCARGGLSPLAKRL